MLVDFFIWVNDVLIKNEIPFIRKTKLFSLLRFINRYFSFYTFSIWCFFTNSNRKFNLLSAKDKVPVIISLTSFPGRLSNLNLTLETILRQTLKPERILVYLSSNQVKNTTELPKKLQDLVSRGVDFIFVSEDLKSHKKYFYVLNEFKNHPIITIDDDLLYDSRLIERLFSGYQKDRHLIYCNYSYTIKYTSSGNIEKYRRWQLNTSKNYEASFNNFFGSGGGTLFPPNALHVDVLNIDVVKKICFDADDIWLNAMARLNGTKICQLESRSLLNMPSFNIPTLASVNLGQNKNDLQLREVSSYCIKEYNMDPFEKDFNKAVGYVKK